MPDTWPRIQLLGRGFGQNASTWKCGTAGFCASAGAATKANAALRIAIALLIMSSLMTFSLGFLMLHSQLRRLWLWLFRGVERENPGAVEERRRRHLAVVGELLTRLQRHARGPRLSLGDVAVEARRNVSAVFGEI